MPRTGDVANRRGLHRPRPVAGAQDTCSAGDAMCAMMSTARMIHRFAESRIAAHHLPAKMSGPRMGVLFSVREAGGLRMGDLASRLGVAPRTVTDLVDVLERDGLLIRRPDPADRRATRLELTPVAAAGLDRLRSLRRSFVEEIFSPLKPAERRQLVELLEKISRGPIRQFKGVLWSDPPK